MSKVSKNIRSRAAVLAACGVIVVVGAVATVVSFRSSPGRGSQAGAMVDIGGYELHLTCTGRGSPTVLLESGNGPTSSAWAWVQPEIAETTRVCSYDRAGTGRSEESPNPRDAHHIAQELHSLVEAAQIELPLVLVGHSYGGLYVRQYAAMYPGDVAGMVLVDSAHPDQWSRVPGGTEQYDSIVASMSSPIEVAPTAPPLDPDLPPAAGKRMAVEGNTVRHLNTARAEFLATTATNDQVRGGSVRLANMPLVVLAATNHDFPPEMQVQMERIHLDMQRELAGLSSGGVLRVVNGADHNGLLSNEASAHTTARAIADVLTSARNGGTLSGT